MEIGRRNKIRYELLSDSRLKLTRELRLPIFEIEPPDPLFPKTCIKRLTLVVESGKIRKTFYPVFPPDRNAEEIVEYLRGNTG